MEGNKVEAEKCVDIAVDLTRLGDIEQALKFLKKAESLYPTDRAKHLLKLIGRDTGGRTNRSDNNHAADSTNPRSESPERYSEEQQQAVQQIRGCKDHYEVLNVGRDCSDGDLKKAYKRLARQFHPDKNLAPGSDEAFKVIVNAQSVLCDPVKRKTYDESLRTDSHRPSPWSFASSFKSSSSSAHSSSGSSSDKTKKERRYGKTKSNDFYWYDFNEYYEEDDQFASDFFRQFYDSSKTTDDFYEQEKMYSEWSKSFKCRNTKFRYKSSDSQKSQYQRSAESSGSFKRRTRTSAQSRPDFTSYDPQSFRYTWYSESKRSPPPSPNARSTGPTFSSTSRDASNGSAQKRESNNSILDISPILLLIVLFLVSTFLIKD